jgi:hypothetical protein
LACTFVTQSRALEAAEKRRNAVILSSSEGSRSARFQGNARFFVACWLLRMTVQLDFSAAFLARHLPPSRLNRDKLPAGLRSKQDTTAYQAI